jgi:hypothetical protein
VKWRKSKAKRILYELLMDGTIPLDDTMPFEDFFSLSQEFALYDPEIGFVPCEIRFQSWTKGLTQGFRCLQEESRGISLFAQRVYPVARVQCTGFALG